MGNDLSKENIDPRHPGCYLQEAINEAEMTQHELAVRTGVSDKHVSTILNCEKGISASYARKLEYVFGSDKYDWAKLQAEYDLKMIQLEEEGKISREEANEVNYHLIMNHSMLEDTLVFATAGVSALWILSTRLLFALVLVWGRKALMAVFRRQ